MLDVGTVPTFWASDIHLGRKTSRAAILLRELRKARKKSGIRRVIFIGDTFDDIKDITDRNGAFDHPEYKKKIPRSQRKLIRYLRKLVDKEIEVILIEGNHDRRPGMHRFLSHLKTPYLPFRIVRELRGLLNGVPFIAMHGDQFDRQIRERKWISEMANTTYRGIQKIDWSDSHKLSYWVERRATSTRRKALQRYLPEYAIEHAKRHNVRHIFCGHSHEPVHDHQVDGVHFHNTGCWADEDKGSYLITDETGVRLFTVKL